MKRCFLLLSLVVLVAPCSRADEAIAHQGSQTNDTVSAQTIYVPKAKVKAKKKRKQEIVNLLMKDVAKLVVVIEVKKYVLIITHKEE